VRGWSLCCSRAANVFPRSYFVWARPRGARGADTSRQSGRHRSEGAKEEAPCVCVCKRESVSLCLLFVRLLLACQCIRFASQAQRGAQWRQRCGVGKHCCCAGSLARPRHCCWPAAKGGTESQQQCCMQREGESTSRRADMTQRTASSERGPARASSWRRASHGAASPRQRLAAARTMPLLCPWRARARTLGTANDSVLCLCPKWAGGRAGGVPPLGRFRASLCASCGALHRALARPSRTARARPFEAQAQFGGTAQNRPEKWHILGRPCAAHSPHKDGTKTLAYCLGPKAQTGPGL